MYLSLIFFLILIIPFIVMSKPIAAGSVPPYRIVLGSVLMTAVVAVIIFMAAALTGDGLYAQIQDAIKAMAKVLANDPNVTEMLHLADVSESERVTFFTSVYSEALQLLPACIFVTSAVVSYIVYCLLSRSLSKRLPQVKRMPKFREFSLPQGAISGLFLMYLVSWLLTLSGVFENEMLYKNVNYIFDFAFSLQGVSVVLMLSHMKRVPKAIGVIVAAVLWVTTIGRSLLVILGMIDLIMGLKMRIQSNPRR